jgi:hypothetical protein
VTGARACGGARHAGRRARGTAIRAASARLGREFESAAARGVTVPRSVARVSAPRRSCDGQRNVPGNVPGNIPGNVPGNGHRDGQCIGPNDGSTANGTEQRT